MPWKKIGRPISRISSGTSRGSCWSRCAAALYASGPPTAAALVQRWSTRNAPIGTTPEIEWSRRIRLRGARSTTEARLHLQDLEKLTHRAGRLLEGCGFVGRQLDFHDLLGSAGAELDGHAEVDVLHLVLA